MYPTCYERGKCFAQRFDPKNDDIKWCNLLQKGYRMQKCPFRKPVAEITKGKRYPFDQEYGVRGNT